MSTPQMTMPDTTISFYWCSLSPILKDVHASDCKGLPVM